MSPHATNGETCIPPTAGMEETDTTSYRVNGYPPASPTAANGFEAVERDKLEPIAVVGISLRFPQDATSPSAFWQMLADGRSALTEIPRDRFNVEAFSSPEGSSRTGSVSNGLAYFLNRP